MSYSKEQYEKNKASIAAAKKRYYEKNKEKIKQKQREYDQAHKEEKKAYYQAKKLESQSTN